MRSCVLRKVVRDLAHVDMGLGSSNQNPVPYKPTFSHTTVPAGSQYPRSCWLWSADAKELPLMLNRWHDWHRMVRVQ